MAIKREKKKKNHEAMKYNGTFERARKKGILEDANL